MSSGEYYDSEDQMFWEGHLIRLESKGAAIEYSRKYQRDTGYCSRCGCWVDREAHFTRDVDCRVSPVSTPRLLTENELTVEVPNDIASQVLLIGWDCDRHGENVGGFGIDYFGTAMAPRAEQLAECLERADRVACAHLAVRTPDGEWIIGQIRERIL